MKKTMFLKILLLMFLSITSAYAAVPDFLVTMKGVFSDMATEVIIGIMILAIWIIAGFATFFKGSGYPLKWVVIATVIILAAPFIAGDTAVNWAQTTFGT